MDILFIHGNYPAQFRHLCAGFGANSDHRTVFLTSSKDTSNAKLEGVQISVFEQHRKTNNQTHHYLHSMEDAVLQGQAVLRNLDTLIQNGFQPQLVIFHGGTGLGLFLRDVLPKALIVGYFEWWFTPETTKNLVKKFDLDMQLCSGLRNLPTADELINCDAAVVPTKWQKNQFPELLQQKLEVIFDGIDTSFFHPPKNDIDEKPLVIHNRDTQEKFCFNPNVPILSYATRGMEPLRGFPEFMHSLPLIFEEFNDLEVVIAGADRCAYSYCCPTHGGSWKKYFLEELKDKIPLKQLHFTGLLNYPDYRSLLWRSNLHCYFTRPYVTSWSFFEAASCGSRLLSNISPATRNIVEEKSINWAELENQDDVNMKIIASLKNKKVVNSKRARIKKGFELERNLLLWQELINKLLAKKANMS